MKTITELTESLQGIRDSMEEIIEDMEAHQSDSKTALIRPAYNRFNMSLFQVHTMIHAGLLDVFNVADEIWTDNAALDAPICWKVIGKETDGQGTLTLWAPSGFGNRPFDIASDQHPYGLNIWRDCSLRKWLNGPAMEGFDKRDRSVIKPVETISYTNNEKSEEVITTTDSLWLLSMDQIGLHRGTPTVEGTEYPYFKNEDNREIGTWWRLRSAYRGYAVYAWIVSTSGGVFYYGYARGAFRCAPACVIH